MPEIAEVETVRRTLLTKIKGKKIIDINILYTKMIENDIKEFKEIIINKTFEDIKRIGKWLIFDLGDFYLLSHLRMEGKYFIKNSNDPIIKHEHIIFNLNNNEDLRYHDTRKFGRMVLLKRSDLYKYEGIKKQGIEPNSKDLTVNYLKGKLNNKRLPIKTCLLDQTIISGLGNIYADEVLFNAKVNPLRQGCSLTDKELDAIIKGGNCIIKKAIEEGGTTIKSYTSSLGVTGRFQQYLKVHKKEGQPCSNCDTIIKRIKVNGRSTYFCEKCQN